MSVNEAPERIWWNPEGHWSSYDDSAIRQSPSFEYITVAASDARVQAAVRAGMMEVAKYAESVTHHVPLAQPSQSHRNSWMEGCKSGAVGLIASIRALAADDAAVARIARGLAP